MRIVQNLLFCHSGETFNVTIERSAPGMGVVTVDWSIESPLGLDPALSFRQTNGQITFEEVRDGVWYQSQIA